MLNAKLLAAMSLGLIAAACSSPYDRQASVPANTSGTMIQSERVSRGYAEARLLEDSRSACYDYGLDRGTQRYDNCVAREVDARRYREQSQMSAPPVYTPAYIPAPTPYVYVAPPTTGTAVSRDEFGFRYDAEGNRLDRNGRIISPQSTTP